MLSLFATIFFSAKRVSVNLTQVNRCGFYHQLGMVEEQSFTNRYSDEGIASQCRGTKSPIDTLTKVLLPNVEEQSFTNRYSDEGIASQSTVLSGHTLWCFLDTHLMVIPGHTLWCFLDTPY